MKWLDRSLIDSAYAYRLCLSEKEYRKALKWLKLKGEQPAFVPTDHAEAAAIFVKCGAGRRYCLINLGRVKGWPRPRIYGLLVHEAVHVWQAAREIMAETSPSSEFEAYSVQSIAQNLMESYEKRAKRRAK